MPQTAKPETKETRELPREMMKVSAMIGFFLAL
jgi:hypothetical protein